MVSEEVKGIVWKEVLDKYRTRWIQLSAVTLLIFTLAISYFGGSPAGVVGFRKFEAVFVSLLTLVTYLIPLIALVLGSGAFPEEREKGTLPILLSSVATPEELWTGKVAGYALVLAGTVVAGYLPALALVFIKFGSWVLPSLLVFLLSSLLLGTSMLLLSMTASLLIRERTRVLALSLLLWIVIVILYDLSLLGLLVVTKGMVSKALFTFLLLLNPVDVFRMVNLLHVGELKAMLGFATVEIPPYVSPPVLWSILVAWIIVPGALGRLLLERRLAG